MHSKVVTDSNLKRDEKDFERERKWEKKVWVETVHKKCRQGKREEQKQRKNE